MDIIEWSDNFSVEIDIFDEHHKTLVDLLNLLHNVCNDCDNKSIIFFVVESLKDYTVYHFSAEEEYMKKYDYPKYQEHVIEHSSFVDIVIHFENRIKKEDNNLLILIELVNYLRWWLLNHIIISDKIMAQHLIKLL